MSNCVVFCCVVAALCFQWSQTESHTETEVHKQAVKLLAVFYSREHFDSRREESHQHHSQNSIALGGTRKQQNANEKRRRSFFYNWRTHWPSQLLPTENKTLPENFLITWCFFHFPFVKQPCEDSAQHSEELEAKTHKSTQLQRKVCPHDLRLRRKTWATMIPMELIFGFMGEAEDQKMARFCSWGHLQPVTLNCLHSNNTVTYLHCLFLVFLLLTTALKFVVCRYIMHSFKDSG